MKRATVRAYNSARRQLAGMAEEKSKAMEIAVSTSGGASVRSIYRWKEQDISQEAIDKRLGRRGRKPLLSDSQQCLLVGYVVDRRRSFLSVSLRDVADFATSYLHEDLRLPYISETLARFGLSNQKVLTRSSRMVSEEVVEDALSTIAAIREYGFPPNRILAMDETGLWSNVSSPRTYHFRNWCVISIFPEKSP